MTATISSFLVSVAATIAAALVIWAANAVRKMARIVAESTAAVGQLTVTVTTLVAHDSENRERLAALWAREFPQPTSPTYPWSNHP